MRTWQLIYALTVACKVDKLFHCLSELVNFDKHWSNFHIILCFIRHIICKKIATNRSHAGMVPWNGSVAPLYRKYYPMAYVAYQQRRRGIFPRSTSKLFFGNSTSHGMKILHELSVRKTYLRSSIETFLKRNVVTESKIVMNFVYF